MARNVITEYSDDLLGTTVNDETLIRMDVPVTFDGQETTLDLVPATYEALRALMLDKDAHGVRTVFAADTPVKRTREELDEIRAAARAAGMDVKDTGRPSNDVLAWFDNVYVPSQNAVPEQNTDENTADGTETEGGESSVPASAAAPRKTSRKS